MAIEGSTYTGTASDNSAQFTLQPGTNIGPYRPIRPIGEGGGWFGLSPSALMGQILNAMLP
jgi:hypothetical protein